MKKLLKITGIVVGGLLVFSVAMIPVINRGMSTIKDAEIAPVSMETVRDGEHEGSYCVGRWCYNVGVRVEEGRITGIRLLDRTMANYAGISDKLTRKVIERQNVDPGVDAYGGATVTGKAFLKAVEDALTKASE